MFNQFLEDQAPLLKFTGFIAALGALFLNLPKPDAQGAQQALANIPASRLGG